MEEWKEYTIDDICKTIFAGGDAVKYNPTKNKTEENNIPIYANSVDNEGLYGYCSKPLVTEPAVTVAARGAGTGFVCYRKYPYVPIVRLLTLIPNRNVDAHFLYYRLKKNFIKGDGSAIPQLTVPMIKKEKITLPSLVTQQKIANILSSLDDKIEVNRRINEQLEELAQALFKSWFVDFEPFKDSEFVDSELGMIPKGWKVGELSEIGDIIGGATPSKSNEDYYTENGISWITPKDLSINKNKFIDKGETDITEIGYSKCSAKLMPRGSVLFSSRAHIGYIAIAKNELCTNQGFKSVVPKIAGTAFIYFYLKNNVSNIESMASGSTFKEASGTLMKSLKVIIPPSNLLQEYEEKISSIFKKQEYLEEEITHLTALRDTLLPKLMSGEMDVNERGIERN